MVRRAQRRGPVLGRADRAGAASRASSTGTARHPLDDAPADDTPPLAAPVFGAAPRELTGVINLQQTVELVRLTIDVVEDNIDDILDPADAADGARGDPALRPRGRLRHRRGLRPRRRGARRLGRPPRGAGRRRGAARRGRRDRALPGQRARLGRATATSRWCWAAVPAQPHRDRRLRGRTPRGRRPRHGRAVRHPGRPARRRARRGGRPPQGRAADRRALRRRARRGRTGRRRTWPRARLGPGGAVGPPLRRRLAARRPARSAATTCCPSAPSPATATRAAAWSTRSTSRSWERAGTLIETLAAYFRARRLDRGHRPHPVRAPQHGALPPQAGRRGHRPHPDPAARRLHPADRAGPRPAVRSPSDDLPHSL